MQYDCLHVTYSHGFLLVFQLHMTSFSPYRACQHNIRMVYLSGHGYNIMEEIPLPEGVPTYTSLVTSALALT